jgi:hypothetical protein
MKTKSTIVDIKIAGADAGKLVNAKVRREVERTLEAYQEADQLIIAFVIWLATLGATGAWLSGHFTRRQPLK